MSFLWVDDLFDQIKSIFSFTVVVLIVVGVFVFVVKFMKESEEAEKKKEQRERYIGLIEEKYSCFDEEELCFIFKDIYTLYHVQRVGRWKYSEDAANEIFLSEMVISVRMEEAARRNGKTKGYYSVWANSDEIKYDYEYLIGFKIIQQRYGEYL